MFSFVRKEMAKLFSRVSVLLTIPVSNNIKLYSLSVLDVVTISFISDSDRCAVISHCGFNMYFPNG